MGKRSLGLINLLGLAAIGVYYLVLSLWPADYSNPTSSFYVNDYAEAFTSASIDHFLTKSQEVFSRTEGSELGGLQIVQATYAYREGESVTRDKTELFRKWKIGENDMGLLLLYSYSLDSAGHLRLTKSEAEVGYRLSGYLTAGAMGSIFDATLGQLSDYGDLASLQLAQAHAFALVLGDVLPEAYHIDVIPFDEQAYEEYQIAYAGPAYGKAQPVSAWDWAFSARGGFWVAWGYPLLFLGFVLLGDGAAVTVGRGGSSGGGGVTRLFH
jgi:hypothetical protein